MNKDYVSLKSIAADIYGHPKMRDIPFETIVGYTLELMQITGSPLLFFDKEEVVEIHEHRAQLPCDFYELKQIRLECKNGISYGSPSRVLEKTETNTYTRNENDEAVTVTKKIGVESVAVTHQHRQPLSPMFKEDTATFMDANFHPGADLTYRQQGHTIITSIPEGTVRIAYRAIGLDDDGLPLIIDNASFIRALKSYIKMQWFTIKVECDELGKNAAYILQNAQQDYYANIAQAQNSLLDITPEKMRNLANILNDIMPRNYEHASGYADLNKEHSLRTH